MASCSPGLPEPCSSGQLWAVGHVGAGNDPQTHWLGRWPHRLELGTQNRLGLIAWGEWAPHQAACVLGDTGTTS